MGYLAGTYDFGFIQRYNEINAMNTLEQKRHFDAIIEKIERARIRVSEHGHR